MNLAKAIANRLKTLREAADLSQQEVAVRAGLSMSLVAKIEQGKKADPRASTLLALAGALGIPPGLILDGLLPPPALEGGDEPAEVPKGPVKKEKKTGGKGKKNQKKK